MLKRLLRVRKRVLFMGFCYVAALHGRAVAASGGIITGSVIDDKTHAPIAGAQMPSGVQVPGAGLDRRFTAFDELGRRSGYPDRCCDCGALRCH